MILDAKSAHVRLALRAYFTIVFHLLGFIGNECCKCSVKSRLLAMKKVKLANMAGWRSASDQLTSLFRLRRLPGGSLGALMIIAGLLAVLSDLAVSGLVKTVHPRARCPFGTGLVVANTPFDSFQTTPPNGASYTVAAQAQLTSQRNGGLSGIYWKANKDINFHADEEDVIGSWACVDEDNDQSYDASVAPMAVAADLEDQGLLFSNWVFEVSRYEDGTSSHLTAWSTSTNSSIGEPFDVKASIDLTANGNDTKIMKNFYCTLRAPEIEWVLSQIASFATLKQWVSGLQGNMYDGKGTSAVDNVGGVLEWYLNSLVMVAGGRNYLLATPTGDTTQGCLTSRTLVPSSVVALFGTITFLELFLILYWATSWIMYRYRVRQFRSKKSGKAYGESVKTYTPTAILSWMAQAVRENLMSNGKVVRIEERDINDWEFGLRNDGMNIGLVKGTKDEDQAAEPQTEVALPTVYSQVTLDKCGSKGSKKHEEIKKNKKQNKTKHEEMQDP